MLDLTYKSYRTIAKVAQRPPLGWNSWDVFGTNVTEAEVLAQAEVMATRLKPSGYEYLVIDLGWYAPGSTAVHEAYKRPEPHQLIDPWGRLIPDPQRFPSAANGAGFKPLADRLHAMGLKFGIHVMRGIPIQAVHANAPILGSTRHAQEIMKYQDRCVFYDGHYAVDMERDGALAYYQSVLALYAAWGVDFVKADDTTSWPQHYDEVHAFRYALDTCGRPMVLSLSPGACGYMERGFVNHTGDMFRISGDLWDTWPALKAMFPTCRSWKGHTGPGRWADCDMLPLGVINVRGEAGDGERRDRFSAAERRTMVTLWAMFRSPLMIGSDLTRIDTETLALLTHPELLEINQTSTGNDEIQHDAEHSVWSAHSTDGAHCWLALFNLSESTRPVQVDLGAHGLAAFTQATAVWPSTPVAVSAGRLSQEVAAHAVGLIRLQRR